MLVQPPHFAEWVTHQVLVTHLVKPLRRYKLLALFELRIKVGEGAVNMLLEAGELRLLQPVRFVQGFPQVHRGGKEDVGIAHDVNETSRGEQLQQMADTAAVRRRLEDEAARVTEGDLL